jgi:hypothetical protein
MGTLIGWLAVALLIACLVFIYQNLKYGTVQGAIAMAACAVLNAFIAYTWLLKP